MPSRRNSAITTSWSPRPGRGLSKRTGALSLASLREDGIEPMSVASLAALIGTSESVQPMHTMAELAEHFDPADASKSSAKFDPADLITLNRGILHNMPFQEAQDRLGALAISGEVAEPFWNAVRGNLDKLSDAVVWWKIVHKRPAEPVEFSVEDREFLDQCLRHSARRPLGQGCLEGLDQRHSRGYRPKGPAAVHAAEAGAYRTSVRS